MFFISTRTLTLNYCVMGVLFLLITFACPPDSSGDVVPSNQTSSLEASDSTYQNHPWQPLLKGQTESIMRQYQDADTAPHGLLTQMEIQDEMLAGWEDGGEQAAKKAPRIPEPYSFIAGGLFLILSLMGRRQRALNA